MRAGVAVEAFVGGNLLLDGQEVAVGVGGLRVAARVVQEGRQRVGTCSVISIKDDFFIRTEELRQR